jgi:hypothetical protein
MKDLVVLIGCGQEKTPPDQMADTTRVRLERSGWTDRVEVVVLSPASQESYGNGSLSNSREVVTCAA